MQRADAAPAGLRPRPAALPGLGVLVALVAACALAPGCTIQETYVRPDFDTTDRLTLKRVAMLVSVPESTPPAVAELVGRLAHRYVHLKKEYLVLRHARAEAEGGPPRAEALAGTDGVIEVELRDLAVGSDETQATLAASLTRHDGEVLVWRCIGDLSEAQAFEDLSRTIKRYVRELGPEVEPYVAPLFILTKRVFDTLPSPLLDDADIAEKIELQP